MAGPSDGGSSRASFSQLELERWFQSAQDVHLVAPSLVFAAIDKKSNRLTFRLARPDEEGAALEQELLRLGIPLEAVHIERSSPFRFL